MGIPAAALLWAVALPLTPADLITATVTFTVTATASSLISTWTASQSGKAIRPERERIIRALIWQGQRLNADARPRLCPERLLKR